MAEEDERTEELSTISAIYPELVIDAYNPFVASIDLPVTPTAPLKVRFQPAPLQSPPDSDREDAKETPLTSVETACDEHELSHLPPLRLNLLLPEGYPDAAPPKVTLAADPSWLPLDKLRELTEEVEKLWEEYGRMQVLFSYIDSLQQAAAEAFGYQETGLSLALALKPRMLEYNDEAVKAAFDAQTFDCGICLEPKKGSQCYRMARCNHVFCRACLQESFNQYIKDGDVVYVRCLDPDCGKQATAEKRKKDVNLHPRELLDMGIQELTVRRYVEMKRKKQLESDKTTVYCPRTWCQAPARSTKYPPIPANLRDYPDDVDEEPPMPNPEPPEKKDEKAHETNADRLRICSKCSLAFCLRCQQGWHGDFVRCWPRDASELSAEEQASYDYIRLNTSPCPTCLSPTQKTMGCNHMICATCNSHFCFLCTSWLDGQNPYQHFNQPGKECYQRLWEHEEGDEANGGAGGVYFGARRWEQEAIRVAEEAARADREEDERRGLELAQQLGQAALVDHEDFEVLEDALPADPEPPAREQPLVGNVARLGPRGGGGGGGGQRGGGGPRGGGPGLQRGNNAARGRGNANPRGDGGRGRGGLPRHAGERARAAEDDAMRRFIALAARDQEDDWDSDELDDDDEDWDIQHRN